MSLAIVAAAPWAMAQQYKAPPVKSVRLYVFNCGSLKIDPRRYRVKREELATRVHTKGTLMWDVGVVPDSDFKPDGSPATGEHAEFLLAATWPLIPQLVGVGYGPAGITYLAFSHFHFDHLANVNAFAGSTWLVRKLERDIM